MSRFSRDTRIATEGTRADRPDRQHHQTPGKGPGKRTGQPGRFHREVSRQDAPCTGTPRPRDDRRAFRPADTDTPQDDGALGIRLNKYLASAGVCSRRKADELIDQGRVLLNGRRARTGDRVLPGDRVTLDGRPVATSEPRICLMLHKPVRVVSTVSDPQGRTTVLDFVPKEYRHLRLYPVGRLDYYSEGLILLTNDGVLAQRLMHPSNCQHKVYEVLVRGPVTERVLAPMRQGMTLAEGDVTRPARVEAVSAQGNTLLTITLQQGLNRQIRRMCRDSGLTVLRLKRIAEGALALGTLPPGRVRVLSEQELFQLGLHD